MKRLLAFFRLMFGIKCKNCDEGRIFHNHSELTENYVWIEVYECDGCGKEYV